jgi:hypothetical protein
VSHPDALREKPLTAEFAKKTREERKETKHRMGLLCDLCSLSSAILVVRRFSRD